MAEGRVRQQALKDVASGSLKPGDAGYDTVTGRPDGFGGKGKAADNVSVEFQDGALPAVQKAPFGTLGERFSK